MAGIISNVTGDIQRLRELKAAIEDVKKSLKGIDIRVRLDIKESVEAQLKTLSEQYTALVMKIAEAEGKIKLSVHNINKASDSIIQAQEKMSKVTGGTTQQPSSTAAPSNTSAETAIIQAQARAYEDLRTEINAVLGTREANVKRLLDEKKAIDLINAEIKKITKSQGEYGNLSSSQQKRLEQLNNSLLTHKTALAEVRQVLSNNVKMDNAAATSMNELSQSLSRMRIVYRELTEEERKSPFGKELISSIQQADAKIKELDSSIGNHARNVGNYKKEWNGLQYQMQMVARELPNFAINPQIGIMSLTNNIPYLVDELKKAKDAHKAYVSEVKAGNKDLNAVPSVGKQVLSSLLNWQTAIVMGITLITAYRKEITEWVGGLFNANDGLKETKRFQDVLNQSMRDAAKDSSENATKLNILYRAATNTKKSIEERTIAVRELKKEFPAYFGLLDDEKIKAGEAANAYKVLTDNILASARARRSEQLIISEQNKYLDYLGETTNAYIKVQKAQARANEANAALKESATDFNVQEYRDAFNDLRRAEDEYNESSGKSLQQKINVDNLVKTINVSNLYGDEKKRDEASAKNETYWTEQKNIAEQALKSIDSSQLKLMNAGNFKGIDAKVVENFKKSSTLLKEAEKELKVYDSSSKQEKAADTLGKEQEKYNLLMDKQKLDRQRQTEDLETQHSQSKIDAMTDGFTKEQAQRDLNNKKEIQALERQKDDYIRAIIQAEKDKFDAQEDIEKANDPKHKKRTFDASTVKVDTSKYDKIIENTKTSQGLNEWEQREASMNEYLLKYGTFTQKKEAIDKKYREAIEKESSLGGKNDLQKEWEEATANLDLSKLKQEINWEMIFGDLSKVTKEQLANIKKQLQEFKKSPEFKNATPEQIQVIEGALNSVNNAMVDKGGFFGGMTESINELKIATEELKKAEEELAEANKKGTEAEKEEAQKKVNQAKNKQQNAETNVTKSSDKTIQHLTSVGDAIAQLGSSAEMSLSSFGDAAGSIVDVFSEAGSKIGGMVGAIFSILDGIQSQGLDGFVGNILGNVAGAVGGIFDTLTFGAFGLKGADYSEYNEMKEQYESISSIWDELIDKKTEYLEMGTTEERKRTEQEILDLIGRQEQTARNMGKERLNSGTSAGSHSIGVRIRKGMSNEGWSQWNNFANSNGINKDLGGRMEGLFNLSTEQLDKLKGDAPDFWAKLDDDVRKYLEDIIKSGEQTEETIKKAEELWAGMSFDSMVDQFKSALSDMDSSTEDFADDFQQYMINAMIDSFVNGEIFQKKLKDWHKKLAEYSESDKKITEEEKDNLKNDWDKMVQEGLDYRNNLFESMGFKSASSSQNSTQKGFASMSQDTGNELNGRFTALQISNEEIKNQAIINTQSLNLLTMKSDSILLVNTEVRNIADETRTILANSYLELQEIRENTGAIVKPIIQMQKDMEAIKNNTKNM